ncbi:MAG: hypothetical protein DWI21_00240 [Planctomycetota bacterium]|nr:MAG: hypothetical protein DWI21_00240 [Planctomycetota bacterium]
MAALTTQTMPEYTFAPSVCAKILEHPPYRRFDAGVTFEAQISCGNGLRCFPFFSLLEVAVKEVVRG